MDRSFLRDARDAYRSINEKTLTWVLDRPRLRGAFLNTKRNSITLRDYDDNDRWRGPKIHYGWIQGRGLEALIMHARALRGDNPALAARLIEAAGPLYQTLLQLVERDGHAYFAYDDALTPIYPGPDGAPQPQTSAHDLFTYSDIFVFKGLLAASIEFDPAATESHARRLGDVVKAIEDNRFVMEEKQALTNDAIATQHDEYGPRMIMLGAAALLRHFSLTNEAVFAEAFVAHVIKRHFVRGGVPGEEALLRDAVGFDRCNPGHATEFVGLALEGAPGFSDGPVLSVLRDILVTSFRLGFSRPGLRLSMSLTTGATLNEYRPWWSLPETVRSAALIYRHTRDPGAFDVWRRAHDAFLNEYWRDDASLAYQTRDASGPVDYTPATPDLDPGYHTGLAFLSTLAIVDALLTER